MPTERKPRSRLTTTYLVETACWEGMIAISSKYPSNGEVTRCYGDGNSFFLCLHSSADLAGLALDEETQEENCNSDETERENNDEEGEGASESNPEDSTEDAEDSQGGSSDSSGSDDSSVGTSEKDDTEDEDENEMEGNDKDDEPDGSSEENDSNEGEDDEDSDESSSSSSSKKNRDVDLDLGLGAGSSAVDTTTNAVSGISNAAMTTAGAAAAVWTIQLLQAPAFLMEYQLVPMIHSFSNPTPMA